MSLAHNTKAIASGAAALVGATALVLSAQPIDHLGIQYINQLQWCNIVLAVLASYGIVWRVPNRAVPDPETQKGPAAEAVEPVEASPVGDAGRHRADTTALKLP